MRSKNKRRWHTLLNFIVGWTFAFLLLSVVRGSGTIEEGAIQFEFNRTLGVSVFFGILIGIISGIVQILVEERIYKKISLRKLIIFRTFYAFLFLSFLIFVSYLMVTHLFETQISLYNFIFEPGSFAIYSYILFIDFLLVMLHQINLMLGQNNLWKLISGKFYTPHEEERMFMFVDLESSTQIAEQLGHIQYSSLIQDCFNDLGVVAEYDAEIYQYVGDEVILTWNLRNGLRNQNCLQAFYAFKQRLRKRESHYQNQYNWTPVFKAGIHSGIVTVTEVGKYKKEIAYHGDTINTAARIQSKCKELNQEFLISNHTRQLIDPSGFDFNSLGNMPLKGKQDGVEIVAITKVTNP